MPRESKDDQWYRWMKQQEERHAQELEIVRFKIKEQVWEALEANFGTRIPCDHGLAIRLNSKVDKCFDSIEHIRKLNKKEGAHLPRKEVVK
tara:strand:- start:99 stop:371 length:273 start_codon:yes stop_codon:yes gene_type:complete